MTSGRSRHWIGTLNNPTITVEELSAKCKAAGAISFAGQYEMGEQGTKHIQWYVNFKETKTLAMIKKKIVACHLEVCKSPIDAWNYCMKDATRWGDKPPVTFGEPPKPRLNVKGDRKKFNEIIIEKGIVHAVDEGLIKITDVTKATAGLELYKLLKAAPKDLDRLENYWFWGPTGTGKSSGARQKFPNSYIKSHNKWWDGYDGEDSVIIDDVNKKDEKWMGPMLKTWADHYPFKAEFKGGSSVIRPKHIVVTSNWSMDDMFTEQNDREPLKRRFREEHYLEAPPIVWQDPRKRPNPFAKRV